MILIPKEKCIYGQCKARNLCCGYFCVGARLLFNDGYLHENGKMRKATEEERSQYRETLSHREPQSDGWGN